MFIGVGANFVIMPLLGLSLAHAGMGLFGFTPEIAAGVILIGCSPNGMASNVISYLAKANLALSIGGALIFLVLTHNLCGYLFGYWAGRLFKMNERYCRTMAIEVGMQNGGPASGIAKEVGKIATVGLAPAIFGPLMNVTGSLLAS